MYAGETVEHAFRQMREYKKRTGEDCFVKFNDVTLYSYYSKSSCYKKVTGKSKNEWDRYCKSELRKIKNRERNFKSLIPKLKREYRKKARGIIAEEYLEVWDSAVPIRLKDLYHGWDLKCMLELVQVLNREGSEEERFKACKELLGKQDHSGCSYHFVASSLQSIHKDGVKFVEYLKNNS